jgi:tetratricopeptide (TPR) repeat protein
MKPESLVFAAAGALFGLIAGWILGAEQASVRPQSVAAPAAESQPAGQTAQAPPQLDQAEVGRLLKVAAAEPTSASPRAALGNLYFDAERYKEATEWYEAALKLEPNNADVSTDLGVGYYYLNQPDRALAQFDHSLQIDSKHTKTLLNVGIVRAFGKQDLAGAAQAWEQVLALAPASPEGKAARRALDAMKGAHPNLPAGSAPAMPAPGTN